MKNRIPIILYSGACIPCAQPLYTMTRELAHDPFSAWRTSKFQVNSPDCLIFLYCT